MNPPILTVNNLTTRLSVEDIAYPVVSDLSFTLYPGKTVALVGESGCGKSMTAFSILRILPTPPALPSEGEVLYAGKNLLTLSEKEMRKIRGSKISMIFQNPSTSLNPVYPIGAQLMESAKIHLNLSEEEAEQKVLETLNDVRIPDPDIRINDYPHQLSGGMLQRVMIAMAILCSPDILIADEPTTALDVTIQSQILELLRELQAKKKMALLLITHDMGVVAEMADEVIVMYAREKIEQASVEALFDFPGHPYTQGLFGSRISHPVSQRKFGSIGGSVPPLTATLNGCHFSARCPYVMQVCRENKVPLFPLPLPGHVARCFLYDKNLEEKLTDDERLFIAP